MGCCRAPVALFVFLVAAGLVAAGIGAGSRAPAPRIPATSSFLAHATSSPMYYGANFGPPPAPLQVFLNATASGATPPYNYTWEFGDGSSQEVQDAVHTYSQPGRYVARVTVADASGRRATSTVTNAADWFVGSPWIAAQPTPGLGSAPLTVGFAVTEMGIVPATYAWSFGDGASSDVAEPTHKYTGPGIYVAHLNATNATGQKASFAMTVIVDGNGPLDALATGSIFGMCNADVWNRASFQGLAGGGTPGYIFSWSFGEGNATSTLRDPTYSYASPAFHTANLTVTDALGNTATSSVGVVALPPPCPPPAFPGFLTIEIVLALGGVVAVLLVSVSIRLDRKKKP